MPGCFRFELFTFWDFDRGFFDGDKEDFIVAFIFI
jgi:hypothetical protein